MGPIIWWAMPVPTLTPYSPSGALWYPGILKVAHVYVPPLSLPSPLTPKDPGSPSCAPPSNTALTFVLTGPEVPQTASPSLGSTYHEASPLLCYLDSQEIEED
ncbi:hypothetical protein DSO57_1004859 [Entomophthora muscae]|uniref:Uncharacterized protein n=1 Tax=Entomophthora muscae TaxID=34485 RepID=A0ACC2RZ20_9FUNG|nr:hypothetical protein DSO57_1004859 [Entomophthora muscae]